MKISPFLQRPREAMPTLAFFWQLSALSRQAVAYVFPFFPQTGLYSLVHFSSHPSTRHTKLKQTINYKATEREQCWHNFELNLPNGKFGLNFGVAKQ